MFFRAKQFVNSSETKYHEKLRPVTSPKVRGPILGMQNRNSVGGPGDNMRYMGRPGSSGESAGTGVHF